MSDFVEQLREVAAASLLPEDGELAAPGLAEPVEVLRDRWGVPYISAASLDDLWFAQGFVTAGRTPVPDRPAAPRRERPPVRGLRRPDARGRPVRADDRLPPHGRDARRRMGRRLEGDARPVPRGMRRLDRADAGASGRVLAAGHWPRRVPTDDAGAWAAAFVYLAWGLSGNWDKELLRTAIGERLGPDAVGALLPPLPSDLPHIPAGSLGGRLLDDLPRPRGRGFERLGRVRVRAPPPGNRCSRTTRTCSRSSPARGSRCTSALRGTRRAAWRSRSRPASCWARPRTTRGASRTSRATCRTSTSSA